MFARLFARLCAGNRAKERGCKYKKEKDEGKANGQAAMK
jgi:hypothetical protein